MEEMSMGDMMTFLKLRRGKYSLVEEKYSRGTGSEQSDPRFAFAAKLCDRWHHSAW
jgi:hypothetical protein